MLKALIALTLFVTLTVHSEIRGELRRYPTPYRGPVVAQGQSVNRSGSGRHEQVGRFSWGANTTSQSSNAYQHQTDGSYYRYRDTTTSESYHRSPYGNGDSRRVDSSGADRFYDHNGDPSRILAMYRTEHHYRVQRLFERYDSIKAAEKNIVQNIARSRELLKLPHVQAKLTPEEFRGFHDAINRGEAELAGYQFRIRELANELYSLRR